jgi:hypothetical protein
MKNRNIGTWQECMHFRFQMACELLNHVFRCGFGQKITDQIHAEKCGSVIHMPFGSENADILAKFQHFYFS